MKLFFGLFVVISFSCFGQQAFPWSTYTAGSTASFSVTSGCLNMTSSIATVGLPATPWVSSAPTYTNTVTDGTGLKLNVNWDNTNSSVTVQLDFREGSTVIATPVSFSLYNINATSTSSFSPFIDSIIIRGTTLSNSIINPTSITSDVDNQVSAPSVKGHQNGAWTAPSGPETTTNVVFSTAVKRITITYTSGKKFVGTTTSIGSNPTSQYITIGTINTNYTAGGCAVLSRIEKFDLSCNNEYNNLEWKSTNESSITGYLLEKSNDGTLFSSIYETNRNSDNNNYSYSDNIESSNNSYYRLKVKSSNGLDYYSSILASNCSKMDDDFSIYPNPSSGSFSIRAIEEGEVKIVNCLGEIILLKKMQSSYENFDLQLQPGIYVVNLITLKNKFLTKKLIVN